MRSARFQGFLILVFSFCLLSPLPAFADLREDYIAARTNHHLLILYGNKYAEIMKLTKPEVVRNVEHEKKMGRLQGECQYAELQAKAVPEQNIRWYIEEVNAEISGKKPEKHTFDHKPFKAYWKKLPADCIAKLEKFQAEFQASEKKRN